MLFAIYKLFLKIFRFAYLVVSLFGGINIFKGYFLWNISLGATSSNVDLDLKIIVDIKVTITIGALGVEAEIFCGAKNSMLW